LTDYTHVTLVVDPAFGRRAIKQAELGPLWVIDSSENTPVIKEIWTAKTSRFADSPTFVTGYSDLTREEAAIICVGTVHDHHPLWRTFEFVGVRESSRLLAALNECAGGSVRTTSDGFIFERASES
jgi:hypothetical protein